MGSRHELVHGTGEERIVSTQNIVFLSFLHSDSDCSVIRMSHQYNETDNGRTDAKKRKNYLEKRVRKKLRRYGFEETDRKKMKKIK